MRPVKTETTNAVLKAPEGQKDVIDLPITRFKFDDGSDGVESCWQLTEEELEKIKETGKVHFICMGTTHPPIMLSTESQLVIGK